MFKKIFQIVLIILFSSYFGLSQTLEISGIIKERVDKFDKKGNLKENDFEIIHVSNVNISLHTKTHTVSSTQCTKTGEYKIKINPKSKIYLLKIEKKGYLPKISEIDLTNFPDNEMLILEEWDFGIRKNIDNVTSSILKKPFERYYYNLKTRELILDSDYSYEYQVEFGDAIFTQIENIQKDTEQSEAAKQTFAKAKDIINTANRSSNIILENAEDLKQKLLSKNKQNENPVIINDEADKIRAKLELENKKRFELLIAKERDKIYKNLKDSILLLANRKSTKIENEKRVQLDQNEINSEKFKIYAQRQKLEIDRLTALTKEDSLQIELREHKITNAENEIKRAESEIIFTKSKLESEHKELLLKKAENQNQQKIIFIISLLILSVLIGLFLIYRSLNEKKKYSHLLEDQNLIIAEKNDNIMASIKYAKRIQDSILPRMERWKEAFPSSFILFMPKDVVSGDFYWMHKASSNEILFAAADCTGHGVPGGFMSIVGYHSLHRAINQFHLKEPSKILDSMQRSVNAILRQGFGEGTIKDGMDIALCSLNTETKILQYSGAYNPLWIIRGEEILETKATKQAVGAFTENLSLFDQHEIQLEKGDTIYIFSDGYADQFGGSKGKKIMNKGVKRLLLENRNLPIEKQKIKLKKHFYNWMNEGEEDQVDDVCIIGIKI